MNNAVKHISVGSSDQRSERERMLDASVGIELQKLLLQTALRAGSWAQLKFELLSGNCPEAFIAGVRSQFIKRLANKPHATEKGVPSRWLTGAPSDNAYSVAKVAVAPSPHQSQNRRARARRSATFH